MSKHVIDTTAMEWSDGPAYGERYAARGKRLGTAAGGGKLGCSMWEVDPGKAAFPHHAHLAIEEAIYVLSGTGTLRLGDERIEVGPGTYVALPPSHELPHQLINTGDAPLRYLCMSVGADLDVCLYPDTGKVAYFQAPWPSGVRHLIEHGDDVGYFEGEPTESFES